MARRVRIVFQPDGRRGEFPEGTTILEAARSLGIDIKSPCGGRGICGKCLVKIELGGENVSDPSDDERRLLSEIGSENGFRLACLARVLGDIVVSIPPESRSSPQIILIEGLDIGIELKPAVRNLSIRVTEDLGRGSDHLSRILEELEKIYGIEASRLEIDLNVIRSLPKLIGERSGAITLTIWRDREIISADGGYRRGPYGIAIDLGTTTIVCYLLDLSSGETRAIVAEMNPQIPFGEDVISRISFAIQGEDKLELLRERLIEILNSMIERACRDAGISVSDIKEVVVVGNTAMHHIFLGIWPERLALSPYVPAVKRSLYVKARDLGLRISPGAYVYTLPIIAGWVGADCVSVILATRIHEMEEPCIATDIGTNNEIVLGWREKILACSTAAGPAFEGAHIEFGMRAAPGAISRVRIDHDTLEPIYETIGSESPKGICGSGIVDVVAELYRVGIVDRSGRFRRDIENPRIRRGERGYEYVLAWARETSIGRDITITQRDIREIQLAKGAMCAGMHILMREAGIEAEDIARIFLAGAFGNYIDPISALIIGMLPDVPPDRILSVGNAAGTGARIALLNEEKRREAEDIALRRVRHVNLAMYPDFEAEFSKGMWFPHMDLGRYPRHSMILELRRKEVEDLRG